MVRKSIELLAGEVRVRVRGGSVERFLNICARGGISLRKTTRVDFGELHATLSVRDFKRLRGMMGRTGCRVHILKRRGAPFALYKMRGRYVFFAGFAALAALFFVLVNFVWVVEISAQPGISTYELRETLRQAGAYSGVPIYQIDETAIRLYVREKMADTVDFVTVSRVGNLVSVKAFGGDGDPTTLDDKAVTGVVAARDGVVTDLRATGGYALVKKGDVVQRGQQLISAVTPPTTLAGMGHIGHGMAEVQAKTSRSETAVRLLARKEKRYTGKKSTQFAVVLGDTRYNLYLGGGMAAGACDKRVSVTRLAFGRGVVLPVSLVRQDYAYYEQVSIEETAEEVQQEMEQAALARAQADMIRGEVLTWSSEVTQLEGAAQLDISAQCIEEIGIEVSQEGAVLPPKEEPPP